MAGFQLTVIFEAEGHSGSSYYIQITNKKTGYIWNAVTEAMEASPDPVDSGIALVENGSLGQFPIIIPYGLPEGHFEYTVVVKEVAGSIPQNTDNIVEDFMVDEALQIKERKAAGG